MLLGAGLVLAVMGAGWFWQHHSNSAAKPVRSDAVLVVTALVTRRDVPVYAEGLGRVRPLNSVLVRSQVDGQIAEVAFHDGQEVHAGDLLVQIDPRSFEAVLRQRQAKREQDQAQLDSARRIYESNRTLRAKGAIDQQAFEVQEAATRQLEALVQADEAAVMEASVELEHTRITAPISGRAGLRLVDRGNLVRASDATGLVVINQVQPISVSFTLPERQFAQVTAAIRQAAGEASGLAALAVDRDRRLTLDSGQLEAVDNQIDEASGTIRCKARFANEALALWPGQFVNIRLLVETKKAALVIPAAGIQQGPDGYFAYVAKSDHTAEFRALKGVQVVGGIATFEAGLNDGETIVVDGQYMLRPGASIRERETKKTPSPRAP